MMSLCSYLYAFPPFSCVFVGGSLVSFCDCVCVLAFVDMCVCDSWHIFESRFDYVRDLQYTIHIDMCHHQSDMLLVRTYV